MPDDARTATQNFHREALSQLIEYLGREIERGKYDDRQRVVLGRCERWAQEKLKRADELARIPRVSKKHRPKFEEDED